MQARKLLLSVLFCSFLIVAGCAYTSVKYQQKDDLLISAKHGSEGETDIRDFIRPEETKALTEKIKQADLLIDYVVSLKTTDDNVDYWQYPAETITKGGGDCEDKVFLLASALIALGETDVYAVKGHYLGGGHFWIEYRDGILDPGKKSGQVTPANKALGYTPFFKFNNKVIYVNKKLYREVD